MLNAPPGRDWVADRAAGKVRRLEHRSWKRPAIVLRKFTEASRRRCQQAGQQVPGAGTLATMSPGRRAPNVMIVRNVPWWGLFSSGAAPVLMVGGWTVATSLQPRSVNPVAETVSELAAVGAAERWVMTATFLAVGLCYIATGLALRPAALAGWRGGRPRRRTARRGRGRRPISARAAGRCLVPIARLRPTAPRPLPGRGCGRW
jgi:hypothetical protein